MNFCRQFQLLRAFLRSRVALILVLAFVVTTSSIGSVRASSCLGDFLKNILVESERQFERLSDMGESQIPTVAAVLGKAQDFMTADQRYEAIRPMAISQIVAAPGHTYLRTPAQLEGLTHYIQSTGGGDFSADKILINLVTDTDGNIKSVDLWNAHHRLTAYLQGGYKTIGEINPANIQILVNGKTELGEIWDHYLSIGATRPELGKDLRAVPEGGDIRIGTVAAPGILSNYELGSRTTVGQLRQNMLQRAPPKIGIYFGTFDPIHEGHVAVARQAAAELGLDEVLLVPNSNPVHKPGASPASDRVAMVGRRISGEPKLNVYTGDTEYIVSRFGRAPFIERISQLYGTRDLYQIIGEDSFKRLLEEGRITPQSKQKYFVVPRPGEVTEPVGIPQELNTVVKVSTRPVEGISSSAVRAKVRQGEPVPQSELHPTVRRYIEERHLYREP